jgi:hypothetical protein
MAKSVSEISKVSFQTRQKCISNNFREPGLLLFGAESSAFQFAIQKHKG